MHAVRFRPLLMNLFPALAVLAATASIAPTVLAQERRTFSEELDPKTVVVFEDSEPAPSSLRKALSPDGKLRAETTYKKVRVYSDGQPELILNAKGRIEPFVAGAERP